MAHGGRPLSQLCRPDGDLDSAARREKAIATGCDEFDIKPIEFESLLATIRRVVANPK
jgi:hypothetical protein